MGNLSDCSDYQWLVGGEAAPWLAEFASCEDPPHQLLAKLRKELSSDRARLVAEQLNLRTQARAKFGPLAEHMFYTQLALQQSTDLCVARYKARRFAQDMPVIDYCCGIGGDLLALAERGPVVGWDGSAEMIILTAANLRAAHLDAAAQVKQGAVEQHPPCATDLWHVDPDRRVGGRRSTRPERHSPNVDTLSGWFAADPHGAVKLAPATKPPTDWAAQCELEWISHRRECRQLTVWSGKLAQAPGQRRATNLICHDPSMKKFHVASFVGDPKCLAPISAQVGRYVLDTDTALRAAGLTDAFAVDFACNKVSGGASYLTCDRPLDHPLTTCCEVLELLPLRISDLAKSLRNRHIGQLEIKTRGVNCRPEQLRKRLKLSGDRAATLLLTRQGKKEIAILARRVQGNG